LAAVENEFWTKGVMRGGGLKFRVADALALVRWCRELKLRIVGLDAFDLTPTSIQSNEGESIDLSDDVGAAPRCWDRAEAHLADRADADLYFEVGVDEDAR
jgi:hypothetical protein